MTKEERKKKALAWIDACKKFHTETSYGPDCQVYNDHMYVVDVATAREAVEIALGEWK